MKNVLLAILCLAAIYWAVTSTRDIEVGGVAAAPIAAAYRVEVVSFLCSDGARTELTVRNVGPPIPFAKVFLQAKADGAVIASGDTYFSPASIPSGSLASVSVFLRGVTGPHTCEIAAIQDGDGVAVSF